MLHVILLIMKIIGIILAVLLGIVILLLLLLLFVPIRYRASLYKREEFRAEAKITWLYPLLSVPAAFRDGELSVKIKVLGITVRDLMADEEEVSREVKDFVQDPEEIAPEVTETVTAPPKANETVTAAPVLRRKTFEKRQNAETSESGIFDRLWNPIRDFFSKIRNLKYTIRRFCVKIKKAIKKICRTRDFVMDERTKAAVGLCTRQIGKLLKKLLPGKLRGEIHFGMEDPALTGEILGGISIFYPAFKDNVKVIPDFEESCLEGELLVKGRLRLVTVVQIAWKLFWDKNVRYVYRKLNL